MIGAVAFSIETVLPLAYIDCGAISAMRWVRCWPVSQPKHLAWPRRSGWSRRCNLARECWLRETRHGARLTI